MAVEIPLFEKTGLPPSRTSGVKPPSELADQSGQAAIGQSVATFSGAVFNRLEQARVANEEAQFQGFVKEAMGEYDVFVASNPGASFQLEKERETMLGNIKNAGNTATMPRAKQSNANWYKSNLDSIRVQTQVSMEAIRSKQELATYNQLQENNIKSLSVDGKAKYNENMEKAIDNGLIEESLARAKQVEDFDIMDVANTSQIGFAAWSATVSEEDLDGDLEAGFDAINAIPGLSGDQKARAESAMKTRVSNRRAESKLQADQAEDKSIDEINGKLNKNEFDGINAFINSQPISETVKNQQIRLANNYIASINAGKDGIVTSDETNIAVDRLLRSVRRGELTYDEGIAAYRKLSPGVNSKEGKTNLDAISDAADSSKDPVLNKPEVVRGLASMDVVKRAALKALGTEPDLADVRLIEHSMLKNQQEYQLWVTANSDDPDFTRKNLNKIDELMTPAAESVTLGWFEKLGRSVGRRALSASAGPFSLLIDTEEERLESLESEVKGKRTDSQQKRIDELKKQIRSRRSNQQDTSVLEPKTQVEFDAIPVGTEFIDDDGIRKVKQ